MRKLLVALLVVLGGLSQASANVPCVLPFTLTNATLADATQVQANYNQLVSCLQTGAAASGANNDITSITGLTTPLSPGQGGSAVFAGGVSTGAANAQIIATTVPAQFALTAGYQVNFKAGFTNTGPTQLNVGGTGLTNVFRQTDAGAEALAGGEIQLGKSVQAIFDGTQFQIAGAGSVIVGEMRDYAATTGTPPPGWLLTDGSCQLRATYPSLFAAIGTVYDVTAACDVNHFALPDYRGRVTAYKDNMGGSTASRITVAGGNFNGTTIGAVGGAQNHTLVSTELPASGYTFTGNAVTASASAAFLGFVSDARTASSGGGDLLAGQTGVHSNPSTTVTATGTVTVAGGGQIHTILSPVQIAQKIIKF